MPVVCNEDAGLIRIMVFLVIKNCLKLLNRKNSAVIKRIIPSDFITNVCNAESRIGTFFCIYTAATKIKT